MTKPPRNAKGGWCNPSKLPRGPNGRALCRQCGGETPAGRKTFCGQPCVDAWQVKTQPSYAAELLRRRDAGVCALCSLDCEAPHLLPYAEREAWKRANGVAPHRTRYWDVDHIVPVVDGGGSCDLSNLRTLCCPCHKRVTAELAARRAAERRGAA